jgi:hypothetical protein
MDTNGEKKIVEIVLRDPQRKEDNGRILWCRPQLKKRALSYWIFEVTKSINSRKVE